LAGAFIIFFYFAYIDLETLNANKAFWRGTRQDWSSFAVIVSMFGLVALWIVWRYGRRLQHWELRLTNGESFSAIPTRVRNWAAAYPLLIAVVSLVGWTLIGLFFAQGGLMIGTASGRIFWRTFIGIVLVGGVTVSALVLFAADNIWRHRLPIFFPDGKVNSVKLGRITVAQRLIATLTLTGLVPLVTLGVAARNSVLSVMQVNLSEGEILASLQLTILFIVSVAIVSNIFLSTLTARGLLQPLRQLDQAMRRVGSGIFHERLPIMSNDELGDLTRHFNQMVADLEQSQKMRDLFGRYVSREVAEQVLKNGASLGGESVVATALFSDIRDFTGLSERVPAQQVVDILNRYYTRMVDVIVNEGGLVNKFGGDSLLAIFGAPIRQPDHALRAVQAARQMNRALVEFNAEQEALGLPPLAIGIGISSGEMVAGNIGGQARMEYTVIGDPVNLASRLESLTKEWGKSVLLSEETQVLLEPDLVEVEPCDRIAVRGKQQPTMVFALADIN
jgi:class 3 adenylate cyclase